MAQNALIKACDVCGGQKALAARIGTTQSQIWYWLRRAKKGVPAEYCHLIEAATDGIVTRHMLRPDIYPPEPETLTESEATHAA